MDAKTEGEPIAMKNKTTLERTSDREVIARRTFDAPARLVFQAWTMPDLFKRWWVPKSVPMTMVSCEMDARTGGSYRLVFAMPGSQNMEFFGNYTEVTPHSRLVWTNDEGDAGQTITTVTFEETGEKTLVAVHELYPSKEALDGALTTNLNVGMMRETHAQLDELLATLGTNREHS